MKKKSAKNIIIFFLVFLPLHYAVVGVVGIWKSEPWPAFVMPAFKSVFDTQETITVDQLKFYVENKTTAGLREIQPEVIFDGIVQSQLQGFFRTHFSDTAAVAGYGSETKAWLKKRIDTVYPSSEAKRLHLQWVKKSFSVSVGDSIQETTQISKELTIPLNGE